MRMKQVRWLMAAACLTTAAGVLELQSRPAAGHLQACSTKGSFPLLRDAIVMQAPRFQLSANVPAAHCLVPGCRPLVDVSISVPHTPSDVMSPRAIAHVSRSSIDFAMPSMQLPRTSAPQCAPQTATKRVIYYNCTRRWDMQCILRPLKNRRPFRTLRACACAQAKRWTSITVSQMLRRWRSARQGSRCPSACRSVRIFFMQTLWLSL